VRRATLSRKLGIVTRMVTEPVPVEEVAVAERILARLVARAYLAQTQPTAHSEVRTAGELVGGGGAK
jgi:hypothetical protein